MSDTPVQHSANPVRLGPDGHKYIVESHPRHVGPDPGHLSECLLVTHPDHPHGCTCDDWGPF